MQPQSMAGEIYQLKDMLPVARAVLIEISNDIANEAK
jgi:hypothetical protein